MSREYDGAPKVLPAGDAAVLIPFGEQMTEQSIARSHSLARLIRAEELPGLRAMVIGRSSLMVHYDPLIHSYDEIRATVGRLIQRGLDTHVPEGRVREIPTLYGGPYGPDLAHVAGYHKIGEEEVVRLQSGATYLVGSMVFAPGQPFLMGLPQALVLPRRPSPVIVPAGAVLVANQTALYPFQNPTGWWQIGRTPLRLFNPHADPPTHLLPGDRVRFVPIAEQEYVRMGGERCA